MKEYMKCSKCGKEIPKSKYPPICLSCSKSRLKLYNNYKIKNLEDGFSLGIDSSIVDIFKKINETKDEGIKSYLKELIVIRLVTSVEIHFRDLMRYWYSAFDYNLPKLFPKDPTLKEKIDVIRKRSTNTLLDEKNPKVLKSTKNPDWNLEADIVATSFNFQNLDSINDTFSKLVNLNFFQAVKDLDESIGISGLLKHNWDKIEMLFELRHQVIHNGNKIELSDKELQWSYIVIVNLINKSIMFFDCYFIYDMEDDGNDELFELIGISYEHIKQIMEKNKI